MIKIGDSSSSLLTTEDEPVYAIVCNLTNCTGATTNPTKIEEGSWENLTFTANAGYILPESINVSGVEGFTWDVNTGLLYVYNPTSTVSITISAIAAYSISCNLVNCTAAAGNPTIIAPNGDVELEFYANDGYLLTYSGSVSGSEYDWLCDFETVGYLRLFEPYSNITVTPSTARGYTITENLDGYVESEEPYWYILSDEPITLTYYINESYRDWDEVSVTGATYTWTAEGDSGYLTLSNPTSQVNINISTKQLPFSIIVWNYGWIDEDPDNPTEIYPDETVTLTFYLNSPESHPWGDYNVSGASATWEADGNTGYLTITKDSYDEDVNIDIWTHHT